MLLNQPFANKYCKSGRGGNGAARMSEPSSIWALLTGLAARKKLTGRK
jgi:hypothetical protein